MAKKANKKPAYSTKNWIEPEEPQTAAEEQAEAAMNDADPAPAVPAPEPGKHTLEQAIEQFKKNPRSEQFWCPGTKGFALAVGNMYLQFKDHFFTTSDPKEVEALMRANDPGARYNVHFFAMNPDLRNIKPAKK